MVVDSAGFSDTSGYIVDLANMVGLRMCVQACQNLLPILVLTATSLTELRGEGAKDLISMVTKLFGDKSWKNSMLFFVTKTSEGIDGILPHLLQIESTFPADTDEHELLELLVNDMSETLEAASEDDAPKNSRRVFIVNPPDGASLREVTEAIKLTQKIPSSMSLKTTLACKANKELTEFLAKMKKGFEFALQQRSDKSFSDISTLIDNLVSLNPYTGEYTNGHLSQFEDKLRTEYQSLSGHCWNSMNQILMAQAVSPDSCQYVKDFHSLVECLWRTRLPKIFTDSIDTPEGLKEKLTRSIADYVTTKEKDLPVLVCSGLIEVKRQLDFMLALDTSLAGLLMKRFADSFLNQVWENVQKKIIPMEDLMVWVKENLDTVRQSRPNATLYTLKPTTGMTFPFSIEDIEVTLAVLSESSKVLGNFEQHRFTEIFDSYAQLFANLVHQCQAAIDELPTAGASGTVYCAISIISLLRKSKKTQSYLESLNIQEIGKHCYSVVNQFCLSLLSDAEGTLASQKSVPDRFRLLFLQIEKICTLDAELAHNISPRLDRAAYAFFALPERVLEEIKALLVYPNIDYYKVDTLLGSLKQALWLDDYIGKRISISCEQIVASLTDEAKKLKGDIESSWKRSLYTKVAQNLQKLESMASLQQTSIPEIFGECKNSVEVLIHTLCEELTQLPASPTTGTPEPSSIASSLQRLDVIHSEICGRIQNFNNEELQRTIETLELLAKRYLDTHYRELVSLCERCQSGCSLFKEVYAELTVFYNCTNLKRLNSEEDFRRAIKRVTHTCAMLRDEIVNSEVPIQTASTNLELLKGSRVLFEFIPEIVSIVSTSSAELSKRVHGVTTEVNEALTHSRFAELERIISLYPPDQINTLQYVIANFVKENLLGELESMLDSWDPLEQRRELKIKKCFMNLESSVECLHKLKYDTEAIATEKEHHQQVLNTYISLAVKKINAMFERGELVSAASAQDHLLGFKNKLSGLLDPHTTSLLDQLDITFDTKLQQLIEKTLRPALRQRPYIDSSRVNALFENSKHNFDTSHSCTFSITAEIRNYFDQLLKGYYSKSTGEHDPSLSKAIMEEAPSSFEEVELLVSDLHSELSGSVLTKAKVIREKILQRKQQLQKEIFSQCQQQNYHSVERKLHLLECDTHFFEETLQVIAATLETKLNSVLKSIQVNEEFSPQMADVFQAFTILQKEVELKPLVLFLQSVDAQQVKRSLCISKALEEMAPESVKSSQAEIYSYIFNNMYCAYHHALKQFSRSSVPQPPPEVTTPKIPREFAEFIKAQAEKGTSLVKLSAEASHKVELSFKSALTHRDLLAVGNHLRFLQSLGLLQEILSKIVEHLQMQAKFFSFEEGVDLANQALCSIQREFGEALKSERYDVVEELSRKQLDARKLHSISPQIQVLFDPIEILGKQFSDIEQQAIKAWDTEKLEVVAGVLLKCDRSACLCSFVGVNPANTVKKHVFSSIQSKIALTKQENDPISMAQLLCNIRGVAEKIPSIEKELKAQIEVTISEFIRKNNNDQEVETRLAGELETSGITGTQILSENAEFEWLRNKIMSAQIAHQGIDHTISQFKTQQMKGPLLGLLGSESWSAKTGIKWPELKSVFEKFESKYNSLVKQNLFMDLTHLKSEALAISTTLPRDPSRLPIVMAYIFSLWTLNNRSQTFTQIEFLRKPHSVQIVAILQLLSHDKSLCTPRSHFIQIGTGEGKSVVLGVTATLFAILGYDVDVVSYSEYLSSRDSQAFNFLFEIFRTRERISYSTVNALCEKIINAQGNVRDRVTSFLNNSTACRPIATPTRKRVLLIDEVDVFFSDNFLGGTYMPAALLTQPECYELIKFVWDHYSDPHFSARKVQQQTCYRTLVTKMPDFKPLFDCQICQMVADAQNFRSGPPYHVDRIKGKIGYKTQKISMAYDYSTYFAHKTTFAYMSELSNQTLPEEAVKAAVGFSIICGSFSYAKLPSRYAIISGVTGTLDTLCDKELELLKKYKVNTLSYAPSIYGPSRLDFRPINDIKILPDRHNHFYEISCLAADAQTKGRAVLIFFENVVALESYRTFLSSNAQNITLGYNVLVEESEYKDNLISQASKPGAVTLLPRSFGRGIDFKSYKEVDTKGGVLVIQTFLSASISEEIQIRGRTARQGHQGNYKLFLCSESLREDWSFTDTEISAMINGGDYASLRSRQQSEYNKSLAVLMQEVEEAEILHSNTDEFVKALFSFDGGEAPKRDLQNRIMQLARLGSNIANPPPRFVVMCLDESGSMCGKRWLQLLEAVAAFAKDRINQCSQLRTPCSDIISVVGYSNSASVRLGQVQLTPDLTSSLPRNANPRGGTNFAAGIVQCHEILKAGGFGTHEPVLLFMSDGECENGDHEMTELHREFPGVPVYVLGFGTTPKDSARLNRLAECAEGTFCCGADGVALKSEFEYIASSISAPVFLS
ncbi:helicase carboxy-terminal domain protein [Pelomyxa schiedti]|nr:helicase carboxy-terminal domain protein [Pelomyxa schiedti]